MKKLILTLVILIMPAFTACSPVADPAVAVEHHTVLFAPETSLAPTPYPISTPTPTPTPMPTLTAKLIAVGDLMLHQAQVDYGYDRDTGEYSFDNVFAEVVPYLSDGYAIGNLETVFDGGPFRDFPLFNGVDEFAHALRLAGFDLFTTANNHSNDRHTKGILRTIELLDELGIEHVGTYTSQEERDRIFTKEIGGITFSFLAYTYGLNGMPLERDKQFMVNIINDGYMLDDIRLARDSGCDFVVVLSHMGNEYETAPRQVFKNWINLMLDAGADIVLVSHPHVLQTAEFIDLGDRVGFVAYSLGNFVSSQRTKPRDAGVILNLHFEKAPGERARITKAECIPTWVQFRNNLGATDIKVLPVADALQAVEEGRGDNLRPQDINRMKAVWREAIDKFSELTAGFEKGREE